MRPEPHRPCPDAGLSDLRHGRRSARRATPRSRQLDDTRARLSPMRHDAAGGVRELRQLGAANGSASASTGPARSSRRCCGEPVVELTGATRGTEVPPARVYVGTEAALHQVRDARHRRLPRHRPGAARPPVPRRGAGAGVAGAGGPRSSVDRAGGGRIVVQTRTPDHEVLKAAVGSNPQLVMDAERDPRERLGFPPAVTMALVGGPAASELVEAPRRRRSGVEVRERDGRMVAGQRRADDAARCARRGRAPGGPPPPPDRPDAPLLSTTPRQRPAPEIASDPALRGQSPTQFVGQVSVWNCWRAHS